MIQRHRLLRFLFLTFLLTTLTAAWPWPPAFENDESLVRRQDKSGKDASTSDRTSSSPKKTAAITSDDAPSATSRGSSKTEAAGSKASSTSAGKKAASSKTSEEPTKTPEVDEQSPAGGVAMITPTPQVAAAEYYKIGDQVKFIWSYTSLQIPPKAIDVLVSCTANQATYTIASNATYEPTATVVWDTKKDAKGQGNLITENYILIIHDSAEEITAVPQPGELGLFKSFPFGMYIRRPYLPRNEWKCATCSGALSDMERQTLKFVLGMCTITVLSFTWFAGGFMGF